MDSFIAWIGGKKRLRGEIIRRFPKDGVDKYVEPFGGAGWVLFGKEPHKREVYNDINGELVNLFRMAKHHPDALQAELDWTLNSREEFVRQRANALGVATVFRELIIKIKNCLLIGGLLSIIVLSY